MKVLIIANFSDARCGFRNFADQTVAALQRAGVEVSSFDGAYPSVYARHQIGIDAFFPPDIARYDVVHLIWNAMTMNHYSGADWTTCRLTSWWNGGPSDASCPFEAAMQVKWSDWSRDGHYYQWYPVPDWVDDLPPADPIFTVGASSVRGDGIAEIQQVCAAHGWPVNLPAPGQWLSVEDEIRRLARSTVNVCWYHTSPIWQNKASAPSMLLASGRPLAINHDHLVGHLEAAADLYHGEDLEPLLCQIEDDWRQGRLILPTSTAAQLSWTVAAGHFVAAWKGAMR